MVQKWGKYWAPVSHACDPIYSGGRNQEDCGSKPVSANSLGDTNLKNPITKKEAGGVAQGVGPEFKPQHRKKKKSGESFVATPLP
jgi:hypothetical protein